MNTADLSPHLDLDTLADLAEGLLDEDQATIAGEHLAGCPQCRERSAELADVSRILAEAPMPPISAEFSARLDAAIAAEIAANPPGSHDHPELQRFSRRRRQMQLLSAAAAAVVVVGGAATIARSMHSSGSDLAKDHVPADSPPSTGQGKRQKPMAVPAPADPKSGTDYRDSTLAAQIKTVLAAHKLAPQDLTDQTQACVSSVTKGVRPQLVDVARYNGTPATIIVLPGQGSAHDVWITGGNCSILKHTTISG